MYLTLLYFAAALLPMLAMIPLINKRVSVRRVLLEGIICGCACATFIIILAEVSGHGIFDETRQIIEYMAKTLAGNPALIDAMQLSDMTEAERVEVFTEVYESALDGIPASAVIISTIGAYVEYIILSKIMKPQGQVALPMPKFRDFSIPRESVVSLAVIYLLSWILTKTHIMPNDLLSVNVTAIFNFVFCLQGMSVLFMFCYKKGAPKIIAVILTLFFITSWYGKMMLLILGLLDLILNLKGKLR